MDYPDYTTEHQKGKHLTYEDYVKIQVRLQDGWSANQIAVKELRCPPPQLKESFIVLILCYTISTKNKEREFMYNKNDNLSPTDLDYIYNDDGPLHMKGKSTPFRLNPFDCPKDFVDIIIVIAVIVSLIVAWPITGPLLLICAFISYFVS